MSQPSSPASQPRRLRRARVRRAQRVRGLVASALSATALLLVALTGVGGTYAMWVDGAAVTGTTVQSGTAALSLSGIDSALVSNMLPGESVRQTMTVTNTGQAALAVTATGAAVAGFELRIAAGGCSGTFTTLATGAHPSIATKLAGSQFTTVCLEVRALSGTAAPAPGAAADYTVTFDGTQVR
ncbi:TasA family protein [Microbacterium rhizophilus]|uniref:TasA family protein n=1 Tax=Microbacterium rhizophilus TaxID=3138934 RepID=UPI0031E9C6C9